MRFELDRPLGELRTIAEKALWLAKRCGAKYADCRLVVLENEDITVEGFLSDEAKISSLGRAASDGIAIRLLINGTWGFSSGSLSGRTSLEKLVRRAINTARVNSVLQKHPIELAPIETSHAELFYSSPCKIDPFDMPWEGKLNLLLSADKLMKEASSAVFRRNGSLSFRKRKEILLTSEEIFVVQEFMESGASVEVHTRGHAGDDAQRRSYPDAHVHLMRGGWETIEDLEILEHIPNLVGQAELLLEAPYCPEGERDVILLQTMANLHCGHETIHGFEADRVLGWEWTLAGGSFITPILGEIGNYRFGSEHVTILADSFDPRGVGSFACDNEGTPAQRTYLVKEGNLTGLLTSRETVPELNRLMGRNYFRKAGGTMRAMGANPPLIRMVNILIQPGEMSLEEMKDKAPEGTILLGTNKSWSIDDVRRHFNFGTEIAWEKVGDKWELRKNARYAGDNLTFFRSCKGFANEDSFLMTGIGNCGKDVDPIQGIPTGHGSSPGWFGKVKVGSVGHMKGGPK